MGRAKEILQRMTAPEDSSRRQTAAADYGVFDPVDLPPGNHFSRKGNVITPVWTDGWGGHGCYYSNECVGRSVEGFHGGASFSWGRGDFDTRWRAARDTFDVAREDAKALRIGRSKMMDKQVSEMNWHDR